MKKTIVLALVLALAFAAVLPAYAEELDPMIIPRCLNQMPTEEDLEKYPAELADEMRAAYAAVEKAFFEGNKEELDRALERFSAALAALQTYDSRGDYSFISALIDQIEELNPSSYTQESWSALSDAISAIVWDLPAERQEEIDSIREKIFEAFLKLQMLEADYSAVTERMTQTANLDSQKYTEESWKKLMQVTAAIVWGLPIDQQSEVDEMERKLSEAINALELKKNITITGSMITDGGLIIIVGVLCLAAGLVVGLVIGKKKYGKTLPADNSQQIQS